MLVHAQAIFQWKVMEEQLEVLANSFAKQMEWSLDW